MRLKATAASEPQVIASRLVHVPARVSVRRCSASVGARPSEIHVKARRWSRVDSRVSTHPPSARASTSNGALRTPSLLASAGSKKTGIRKPTEAKVTRPPTPLTIQATRKIRRETALSRRLVEPSSASPLAATPKYHAATGTRASPPAPTATAEPPPGRTVMLRRRASSGLPAIGRSS